MKDRLIRLLDSEQLTASKFADKIGVQRSSVSHVLSGRNKPSFDFVQKTLIAFPEVSSDWLILGKGQMISGVPDYPAATLFDPPVVPEARAPHAVDDSFTAEHSEAMPSGKPDESTQPTETLSEGGSITDGKSESDTSVKGKRVVNVMLFYEDNTFQSFDPSK